MTDVLTLKENGLEVSCANVSCGYYNAHTDEEITVKKDLQKCLDFVEHLIEDCTAVYVHQGTDALYDSLFECEEEIHDILHRHPSLSLEDLRSLYSPLSAPVCRGLEPDLRGLPAGMGRCAG